ncbi:MAG: EAL domain-containing protein [Ignavibacteria bacterium]
MSEICSTREAAELLGVSLRTVQLWVDSGILKAWKTAGGHRRISLESVRQAKEGSYARPLADEADAGPEPEVLFAYQPILDRDEKTFGYELLYRNGDEERASIQDPVAATARVITIAFGELGILGAMGDSPCFINVEEQMLFSDLLLTLPAERVVLEIPASTTPTDDLLERCRFLKDKGYRLLLENFRADESPERLLSQADFVKLDSRDVAAAPLRLPQGVAFVAGRVETEESHRAARQAGAHYFQGFHFANLSVARGAKVAPQRAVVLDILAKLVADASLAEIEKRLKVEPAICFSLLRLTNSAALSTGRRIDNLREALMLLGRKNLLRWLQVLLFAHEDNPKRYPSSLMLAAASRGRLLEYLAVLIQARTLLSEKAFMVGILSYVEPLLRVPLPEVLQQLHLSEDLEAALLMRRGVLGELLTLSEAMDRNDLRGAQAIAKQLKISHENLHIAQVESLRFSNGLAHI